MYASDFVKLYALLSKIRSTEFAGFTPEFIGSIRADAAVSLIALDVCVVPKIQNVEILNEISIGKQSPNVNGSSGSDGIQV